MLAIRPPSRGSGRRWAFPIRSASESWGRACGEHGGQRREGYRLRLDLPARQNERGVKWKRITRPSLVARSCRRSSSTRLERHTSWRTEPPCERGPLPERRVDRCRSGEAQQFHICGAAEGSLPGVFRRSCLNQGGLCIGTSHTWNKEIYAAENV